MALDNRCGDADDDEDDGNSGDEEGKEDDKDDDVDDAREEEEERYDREELMFVVPMNLLCLCSQYLVVNQN